LRCPSLAESHLIQRYLREAEVLKGSQRQVARPSGCRSTGSPGFDPGRSSAMAYTLKNLRETSDSAPQFGVAELGEAHFPREELGAEETGLAYHVLRPEKRQAFGHKHENAEEIYVVLSGSGRVRIDDEIVELGTLDALRVDPPAARAFEAGPEGLSLLVFGPRHSGDGELLPDFWRE